MIQPRYQTGSNRFAAGFLDGLVFLPFTFLSPRLASSLYTTNRIHLAVSLAAFDWFSLEILTLFTNSRRRALHDDTAGTVVIAL